MIALHHIKCYQFTHLYLKFKLKHNTFFKELKITEYRVKELLAVAKNIKYLYPIVRAGLNTNSITLFVKVTLEVNKIVKVIPSFDAFILNLIA